VMPAVPLELAVLRGALVADGQDNTTSVRQFGNARDWEMRVTAAAAPASAIFSAYGATSADRSLAIVRIEAEMPGIDVSSGRPIKDALLAAANPHHMLLTRVRPVRRT